jgi:hypothetical protein
MLKKALRRGFKRGSYPPLITTLFYKLLTHSRMHEYSVVILNWKRAHHVKTILDNMVKFACVREILISNGLQETAISYEHEKVKIKNDYEYVNEAYGLDRRFYNTLKCESEHVIILDDDKYIEEGELLKLLTEYEKDTTRVVGLIGRNTVNDKTGVVKYEIRNAVGEVDILITQLIVFQRKYAHLFFLCKPLVEHIYKTGVPYGNGEDIFLSFVVNMYTGKKNFAVKGLRVTGLKDKIGVSHGKTHLEYRNTLCAFLYTHKEVFTNILKHVKL